MESIEFWTEFFGWCTVLNLGIYLISVVALFAMRSVVVSQGLRWFGVSEEAVLQTTYQWIGTYKLAIILFALVPWLALKLMV
ncbi:MAG TPA: hypothetical protein VJL80_01585 [Aeromicrobium sp.]|nr:hypothetical protein [Aeromicrobium sp.]HKY56713.1 hypothetical protein [Aeromicrobium sp.]